MPPTRLLRLEREGRIVSTNPKTIDLEAERVLPLELSKPDVMTVERLTSLSADTIKRRFPDHVIDLSPGRKGMKARKAVEISNGTIDSTST